MHMTTTGTPHLIQPDTKHPITQALTSSKNCLQSSTSSSYLGTPSSCRVSNGPPPRSPPPRPSPVVLVYIWGEGQGGWVVVTCCVCVLACLLPHARSPVPIPSLHPPDRSFVHCAHQLTHRPRRRGSGPCWARRHHRLLPRPPSLLLPAAGSLWARAGLSKRMCVCMCVHVVREGMDGLVGGLSERASERGSGTRQQPAPPGRSNRPERIACVDARALCGAFGH